MSNRPRAVDGVDLHWLDGKAPSTTATASTWGVPWAKGQIDKSTALALTSNGKNVPVQSWPLAYWPDGSLKWTGHAIAADAALSDTAHLAPGSPSEPTSPVAVKQSGSTITVTTGNFEAQIKSSGTTLISSLSVGGSKKLSNGQLVVKVQGQPDEPEANDPANIHTTVANITAATIESDGPVRATIKVTGTYKGDGHGEWLPFTIRLYFSAGSTAIKIQHLFLFDGDQAKDFIKGIGVKFDVPLSDELYDRHVRFTSASGGLWGEAVKVLSGLRRDATAALLNPQFEGTALPAKNSGSWPATITAGLDTLPIWNDYTLVQLSADHFDIWKRTNNKSSWIKHAGHGARANGTGYIGGAKAGGVLFGLHNFWEQHPRQLDIRNAAGGTANVTVWAYSPEAPAMDLRHYDTVAHGLDLAYEDVELVTSNPAGIARSYELTLKVVASTPARQAIADFAAAVATPPQLVASPEFYQSHKLFGGRWNIPDKSRSGAAKIENEKSQLLDFYVAEIEQRQFYGFWNYGDVMHTYDDTRHTWRYDVGGYAWDNAELGTDLWLWMSFLRTGRADVFRIAHAMTRHLSEASLDYIRFPTIFIYRDSQVDFHHIGPFAGLGSRHNVSHWGDGAKEARVSSSTLKRPFYYMTADEQMGDLMRYSLQADKTLIEWEPLRKILPKPKAPTRVRIGPDWTALAGNWFTEWERTNDTKWRDRIVTGMTDIGAMKYGLFTGYTAAVGFDPDTGHLTDEGGQFQASYHLTMLFGGGEFLMELVDTISVPSFDSAWIDFAKYYNATSAQKTAKYGQNFNSGGFGYLYAKLQAYAGERLNDNSLKQLAWNQVTGSTTGYFSSPIEVGGVNVIEPIKQITSLATNDAASFSLAQYAVLAIAPELAPNSFTEPSFSQYAPSVLSTSTIVEIHDSHEKGSYAPSTDRTLQPSKPKRGLFKRVLRFLGLRK
ncbi:unnamed protein product [Rhizoctonia solani]|uniref:Tat pathway signal sequence domain protein n=1 Tax=Rhizoctonia solani TaxID=456999 RepID=A0A8H3H3B0_9AGAM|nr:unnamed protein product [Rhizoctonia solani]